MILIYILELLFQKCKNLKMILIYILELLFQNVKIFPVWKRKKFQNVNFSQGKVPKCKLFSGKSSKM